MIFHTADFSHENNMLWLAHWYKEKERQPTYILHVLDKN